MRTVGFHLRFCTSIWQVVERARQLNVACFQSFLVFACPSGMVPITLEPDEFRRFVTDTTSLFTLRIAHGSYWINLSGRLPQGNMLLFMREWSLARSLEFTHFVLHPGSANGLESREKGIDMLARAINRILAKESEIKLVLENTSHGNMTIGSDINDFALLKGKLNRPERLSICIDTSHAYAFGYDISNDIGQNAFLQLVDDSVGLSSVVLIHLNDTLEKCGSKIDKHALLPDGLIGETMLRRFVQDSRLANVPLVMELPICSNEQEVAILDKVRSW